MGGVVIEREKPVGGFYRFLKFVMVTFKYFRFVNLCLQILDGQSYTSTGLFSSHLESNS